MGWWMMNLQHGKGYGAECCSCRAEDHVHSENAGVRVPTREQLELLLILLPAHLAVLNRGTAGINQLINLDLVC